MKQNKCILCSMLISLLLMACGSPLNATEGKDSPGISGVLFYLSFIDNKIYSIILPTGKKADIIYARPESTDKERYYINSLICGPSGSIVFHVRQVIKDSPESSWKETNKIVIYNTKTKNIANLMVGVASMSFPALSSDKFKLAVSGGNTLIVKDLKTGKETHYFEHSPLELLVVPGSWSPDGKLLAVTYSYMGKPAYVYFIDIHKNIISPWLAGVSPHFSPSGQLVAYLSSNHEEIIIADINGKTKQSFKGNLFEDIDGWIEEDKVIFTRRVVGYKTRIGLADLKTGKIYDLKATDALEISGICFINEGK